MIVSDSLLPKDVLLGKFSDKETLYSIKQIQRTLRVYVWIDAPASGI